MLNKILSSEFILPVSSALATFSTRVIMACEVECPFLNPNCLSYKVLLSSM